MLKLKNSLCSRKYSLETNIFENPMPSSEVAVKVEGVSKKFSRSLRRSLWYGLQDISTSLLGKDRSSELRPGEFWALQDINFEVKKGECLGIIGPNSSGKSTLMKLKRGL